MGEIRGFFTAIGDIDSQHWKTATWWLLYTVIFGLLPTWITILMLTIFSRNIEFQDLVDDGQFAIYSAALIATGLYFVAKEFNTSKFKGRAGFILILGALLIVASLLVGSVTIAGEVSLPVDCVFLRYVSITIFCITVPICFICAAKNEAGIAEDYRDVYGRGFRKLKGKFTPPGGLQDEK